LVFRCFSQELSTDFGSTIIADFELYIIVVLGWWRKLSTAAFAGVFFFVVSIIVSGFGTDAVAVFLVLSCFAGKESTDVRGPGTLLLLVRFGSVAWLKKLSNVPFLYNTNKVKRTMKLISASARKIFFRVIVMGLIFWGL
jgi:hypothetical protein